MVHEEDELDMHLIDAVNRMSSDAFKALVGNLLDAMGLEIVASEFEGKRGDIKVKAGEKIPFAEYPQYLIRFRRESEIVEPEELQDFVANRKDNDTGMIFIDTDGFSENAERYAKEFDIDIVDYYGLAALLRKFNLLSDVMTYRDKEILNNEKGRFLPSIDEFENIFDVGNKAFAKGNYSEALNYFTRAIELKPNYDLAWYMRGVILNNTERYEEAIRAFTKALEINNENEDVWYNMGLTMFSLGRYEEEIECYDKAIELKRDFVNAWNNKGTTLLSAGRYDEAIECYDEIFKFDKKFKKAWNNKGIALKKKRRIEDAIECFTQGLRIDSNYIDAWLNKGLILIDVERFKDAYHCFEAALKIDKNNVQALYSKGIALEGVGQYSKAIECYETILAHNPGFNEANRQQKKALKSLSQEGDSDIGEDFFRIDAEKASEYFVAPPEKERILVEKRVTLPDEPGSEATLTEHPENSPEQPPIHPPPTRLQTEPLTPPPMAPPTPLPTESQTEPLTPPPMAPPTPPLTTPQTPLPTTPTIEIQTAPLILEEGINYKDEFECWGDHDSEDEGCTECIASEKCRQEAGGGMEEGKVGPREGYECYGGFDVDDEGCLQCLLRDECMRVRIG